MKTIDEKLMNGLAEEANKSPRPTKDIFFAGGCFWGTEHYFKQIEGVALTEVGFANGHTENPTYKEVYTDQTGFAETVFVRFYPDGYCHLPLSLFQFARQAKDKKRNNKSLDNK